MRRVIIVFVMFLAGLWSLSMADVISGSVIDSVSGAGLGMVRVTCTAPACTTFTDTAGNFSLNTTAAVNFQPKQVHSRQLSWNPERGFAWPGSVKNVSIAVRNIQGALMAHFSSEENSTTSRFAVYNLPQGMYVAEVTMEGQRSTFKILNIRGGIESKYFISKFFSTGLSKKAASYVIIFEKAEYKAGSSTGTGSNIEMKLQALGAPAGMRHIAAGTFQMGSATGYSDELPVHTVTISSAFYMDTTDVTQADYFKLIGVNPSAFLGDSLRPVEEVTWNDALLYCNARSKRDGLDTVYSFDSIETAPETGCSSLDSLHTDLFKNGYRLPTEAQWEYACRAGSTTPYFWGNDTSMDSGNDTVGMYSWYYGNSHDSTHRVATKLPNAWGLYDMSGNVWQWCSDWYGAYTDSAEVDPTGPVWGYYPVMRGGSWVFMWGSFDLSGLRHSASRYGIAAGTWYNPRTWYNGFRCVR